MSWDDLLFWYDQEEIDTRLKSCSAVDWNGSTLDRPMMVVAGDRRDEGQAVFVKVPWSTREQEGVE